MLHFQGAWVGFLRQNPNDCTQTENEFQPRRGHHLCHVPVFAGCGFTGLGNKGFRVEGFG